MPGTFEALAIAALAILPGAVYMWSYESQRGLWGINFPDRVLRFLGVAAVLHAAAAPLTYWLWTSFIRDGDWKADGHLPWSLYLALLGYAGVPAALGFLTGRWQWFGRLVHSGGRNPPRAWDFLFVQRPDGWVRLRLKSGAWLGGAYDERSYAAGYPEAGDVLLASVTDVDPETGEFKRDDDGNVPLRESRLLIRWDEIEYLEFIDA